MPKIMATLITAVVVLVAVLVLTKAGRDIDAATQRFMLYYAGVLALVGLTGSVLLGLVATDRIVMTPGHRVMAQAVHRAFSFGTLAFLIIHIVTEILAQRSHVIDAVVPFLSPYRTFYIGLGTIASDLIILLVVTSILRKRFTEHGKAWRWRAIHYASYVAFVFAVLHGLLGGRTAKPYVDWSYGFAIAVTALGLAVRFLAISLRPRESLPSSPSADRATRPAGSSPLHAAALGLAQARLGSTIGGAVQVLPAGLGGQGAADSWTALPVPGRSPASGPLPALGPAPVYAGPSADAYHDLGFTPLGAPPYGDHGSAGTRARPYVSADQSRSALGAPARQPLYEPGYDGPPRFQGAPRGHGDVPQDELSSYPYGPGGRGPQPAPYPEDYPDRSGSGPWATRPSMPEPAHPRAALPAPPRPGGRNSGPMPQLRTGSMAQPGTGPMLRPDTGPLPRAGQGQPPRNGMGPGTGPMPHAGTGPMPRLGTGPMPRPDTGPMPRAGQGRPPRNGMGPGTGPMPRAGTGPMPRPDTGPVPRLGTGPMPRFDGRPDTGPLPRPDAGGMPSRPATGPMPRPGTGPNPRPMPRPDQPLPAGDLATGPRNGPPPGAPRRGSHRARPADPRYRDMPGPTGGDEWQ
jgi:DMSO/TMAO reductase YedYZ heme-binding membrane subunit